MEACIVNFRGGRHTKYDNQMVIKIDSVDDKKKAAGLIGKKVSWKTPSGKEINGKITNAHGNTGALRVLFERGMPGQSVGTKLKVE
ncbi:MAG TPA: 50S ribosomal protein L35ae [Candidatus Nanoarchaeia archaeon]|nr:50S ribosomal protein L35ae [Candidatus Nanoarchaeia archaeon]